MVEYRPVPEADEDAYRAVLDYAFRPEAGPAPDHDDDPPAVAERRGLYDGDDLLTTGAHYAFEVAVRGRWLDVGGLSAVATRPEHRKRGLVRRLLAESLAEYRERGWPLSILWPFKHPFYRRFGWGRLGDLGRYTFEPAAFDHLADHSLSGGAFERLEPDDHDELRALDDRFAAAHDLAMRRTEAWYRHRFFASWRDDPFVYGWRRDGELRGYLRYVVGEDDDRVLRVVEFGAPDHAATVNLLAFLARHADQMARVVVHRPADDLPFDLAADPDDVDAEHLPGAMGRLVDVAAGLEALPAPDGVEASLTLEVDDGLVDRNDDTFAVQAADGAFTVEAGEGDGPRARLPVETLSRFAFGTTTVERAALAGGLDAPDEAARDRLSALFPPRELFLREFF